MSYALDNALFQWEEGERRMREADPAERARLLLATDRLLEELRQKLGSEFTVQELSDLYGAEPAWLEGAPATAIDAAFARYAREAADFGGGRPRARF